MGDCWRSVGCNQVWRGEGMGISLVRRRDGVDVLRYRKRVAPYGTIPMSKNIKMLYFLNRLESRKCKEEEVPLCGK